MGNQFTSEFISGGVRMGTVFSTDIILDANSVELRDSFTLPENDPNYHDAVTIATYYKKATSNKPELGDAILETAGDWHALMDDGRSLLKMIIPIGEKPLKDTGFSDIVRYQYERIKKNSRELKLLMLRTLEASLPDMVCCLLRELGRIDMGGIEQTVTRIKAIRTLMAYVYLGMSLDIDSVINSAIDWLTGGIKAAITTQVELLVYSLLSMVERISDPVTNWRDSMSDEAKQCTPLDEFLTLIATWIEGVEDKLSALILDVYRLCLVKDSYITWKVNISYKREMYRKLIRILDWIIYAIQMGQICQDGKAPSVEEINNLLVNHGLRPAVETAGLPTSSLLDKCYS